MSLFLDQIRQLRVTPDLLSSWLMGLRRHEAVWHPDDETWSVLDIVNHLAYEEKNDFRMRLRLLLQDPAADWPEIDPMAAVTNPVARERKLSDALDDFRSERKESLNWLDTLVSGAEGRIDLSVEKVHPHFGAMKAGDLFGSWIAHDLLHIRQIAKLQLHYLSTLAEPYSLEYAGDLPSFD